MFPEGAPNPTRMKNGDERKCKNALSLEDFASQSFKVGERYAKQALAIADFLRGRIYNRRKKANGVRGPEKLDQNEPASTAEQVAAETGVSPATVKRNGKDGARIPTASKHSSAMTLRCWLCGGRR